MSALAVTGLGMISSLGWDAVSSCAAARAGIIRPSPLDDYIGRDPDTGDPEPVRGHTVPGCTEGFSGVGRTIRLGVAALEDLQRSVEQPFGTQTGIFLNLASGLHRSRARSLVDSVIELDSDEGELGPYTNPDEERRFLMRLLVLAEFQVPFRNCRVFRGDQVGFLHALSAAEDGLEREVFSECLIGGIDSYVDRSYAEALDALGLLKTPSRPQGLIPGECAAFLRVERLQLARRRGAGILCVLGAQAIRQERQDRFAGQPALGEALAEVITHVWRSIARGQRPGRLIGNLTGDEYRAYDWGNALVRMKGQGVPADLPSWHPGLFFGEIGAATGPVAVALAARAFARGYAGTDNILT